ncbi:MAG: YgiT-type zinc finger protein [Armatimonadota bacterium]
MKPFEKCPVCGGELIKKEVEKIIRGGNDTAILKAEAEVCMHCGERLYSEDVVRKFEEIRAKLERQQTSDFEPFGKNYKVA